MPDKSAWEELISFLYGIGLLVALVCTVVLGIRYMLVDAKEKSRIKQVTAPYMVGIIILFGGITIWKLILEVLYGIL